MIIIISIYLLCYKHIDSETIYLITRERSLIAIDKMMIILFYYYYFFLFKGLQTYLFFISFVISQFFFF